MKEQTIYIANDGTRFDDKNECEKYESLCLKVKEIMDRLNPVPNEINFSDGCGYIKQNKETYLKCLNDFMNLCAEEIPPFSAWFKQVGIGERHISHAGRILSDYNIKCFNKAYYRFNCTSNETYREYGQPYFALNESECKDICLNK